MKKTAFTLAVVGALSFCMAAAAFAGLGDFSGKWENADAETRGLTVLEIKESRGAVTVRAWGQCHPEDCDWGGVRADVYGRDVSSDPIETAEALFAEFPSSLSEKQVIIRNVAGNRLEVQMLTRFHEGDRRADYSDVSIFVPMGARRTGRLPVVSGQEGCPEGETALETAEAPQRTILPDGTVEIRYPDGTVKRVFPTGGWEVINPDGTSLRAMPIQVPRAVPPFLPGDDQIVNWLQGHAKELLGTLRVLVGSDEAAMGNYMRFEGEGVSLYEKINTRAQTIDYLLRP